MIFENRFKGRTAIVTGGASGLGLAIAERLGTEGANVSLWDLKEEALASAKSHTGASHSYALNVADADQVARAVEPTLRALDGKIDILVASAGISGLDVPVRDYPEDVWRRVIDVNLHGVFHCNRAVVP